ncbi:MAG TPA: hypothetical protein VFI32_02130 [Rhodanobacteraceae bacterium]|nr:hypothetical protein [Rhodanobacteraceae bacterium]
MATKKPLKAIKPSSKTGSRKASKGFTAEERSAMKDRVREQKSDGGEVDVLAAIAKMPDPDRTMAARLHTVIKTNAPQLAPKTWYGMPAYAKDDKVVCYFRPAYKFKDRYATFGFNDKARLDDGAMWPTAFALIKLGAAEEARIVALVKRALG